MLGHVDLSRVAAHGHSMGAFGVRAAYQLHHGDADVVVALALDQRFAGILLGGGVAHELHVYAGAGHNDVSLSAAMFARVRAWYATHGVF